MYNIYLQRPPKRLLRLHPRVPALLILGCIILGITLGCIISGCIILGLIIPPPPPPSRVGRPHPDARASPPPHIRLYYIRVDYIRVYFMMVYYIRVFYIRVYYIGVGCIMLGYLDRAPQRLLRLHPRASGVPLLKLEHHRRLPRPL